MKRIFLIAFLFISVDLMSQEISKVKDFISDWVGRSYRFGGVSKSSGIDCSAFVQRFYLDIYNLKISRTCYYQYKETQRIEKKDLEIGDIVFFNSKVSPSGWHAGIYIGEGEFIHAANYREGVKISRLGDPLYDRIYKGAGRIKKEIDEN